MNNDWEKEAPQLAAIGNKNPFSLPAGYFDSLQEHLNSRLFLLELHPEKANEFKVPEGYFDTLTDQIEGRIFAEKLKEEIIGNNFTVPDGYFTTLQNRINERVGEPVRVIPMRRRIVPSWISYAAAACITIAVSAGLYFNIQNNTVSNTEQAAFSELENVSDQEIIDWLQLNSTRADLPVLIENVGEIIVSPTIDPNISTEEVQSYYNNL